MYLSIGQIIASSIVYHVVKVGRGERSHELCLMIVVVT